MASEIQELINAIGDNHLKTRLTAVIAELKKTKKFGLVFEKHIPELLPIYTAKIRNNMRVARRQGGLTDTFIVKRICKENAIVEREVGPTCEETIAISDLMAVKRFGEAIFPALRPVESVLRGGAAPHHLLIEADNYHALQLLEWLYAGKVDCIYIDPPYNTGARDWKYNNNYVDLNDGWRHSKWLAFMEKRLQLAKHLLKPDTGVLIVTIDEHEVHHLGMLVEKLFPSAYRQMVTIVITARGVAKQGLARVEEYALFTFLGNASACATEDDFLTQTGHEKAAAPWASLLRRGTNAAPKDRPGLVYAITIDPKTAKIKGVGETLADKVERGILKLGELNAFRPPHIKSEAWPIRSDGSLGTWQVKPSTLMTLKKKGFVKAGRFDEKRLTWSINYLKRGPLKEIERGDLLIIGYEWEGGPAVLDYSADFLKARRAKTVWHRTAHDAGTYGSNLLRSILGSRNFEFPKSLYAVRDTLSTVVRDNRSALVVDFFAGSGTTLHAVHLLNAIDNGNRRCILVTNNELSDAEAQRQQARGFQPGDSEWEAHGICRAVTWPRSKFAVQGRRDDGTKLDGEYLTGQFEEEEIARVFRGLEFAALDALNHKDGKKRTKAREALAQMVGYAKAKITGEGSFMLAEGEATAVLFDWEALSDFIEQGSESAASVETVYLPTANGKKFDEAKTAIMETWPPLTKSVEVKRAARDGFEANLDYFRLEFLDRSVAETAGKLSDLLPALWMMAGSRGILPIYKGQRTMLLFEDCPFAILVDESAFNAFSIRLAERPDIDWVFLVTNDQDSFARMSERLPEHIPTEQRVHLWRNYLDNFLINAHMAPGHTV